MVSRTPIDVVKLTRGYVNFTLLNAETNQATISGGRPSGLAGQIRVAYPESFRIPDTGMVTRCYIYESGESRQL